MPLLDVRIKCLFACLCAVVRPGDALIMSFWLTACEGVRLVFGGSGGSFPPDPPARVAMRAGVIFVDLRVLPLLVLVAFLALFLLPVLAVFCPLGLLTILPSLSAQL